MNLRPWQPAMIEHMQQHPRCGVFAKMGAGKTLATAIALRDIDLFDEAPAIVLAPKRVANKTWPDELRRPEFAHLECSPVIGTETERFAALKKDVPLYTINYENLPWLVQNFGASKWRWKTIVSDESTRLKNFRTRQGGKRTQALGRVAWLPVVERFIALTGTPSPNGLLDLWGQLWFLDRGERLGRSFTAFQERWFQTLTQPSGYPGKPTAVGWAQEQIQDRIRDICITIDPADYVDVPEPIHNVIKVELPKKARSMYREMEREMFLQIREHEIEAVHAASRTIKCLQLANGAIYLNEDRTLWEPVHEAKIEALESVIEEAAGTPVLVAYHFKTDLERLRKAFPYLKVFDDKPETEDQWNEGRFPLMAIHPASGGHGSNLQWGGNILVFFGLWWSLELRQQVIERIGPMRQLQAGLDRQVYIHDIVAENTVDEDVLLRHETKRAVQDILLEAMKRRS